MLGWEDFDGRSPGGGVYHYDVRCHIHYDMMDSDREGYKDQSRSDLPGHHCRLGLLKLGR